MREFARYQDLLEAVLEQGKFYTLQEARDLLEAALNKESG
jgi:hypothetical protein